MCYWDLYIDIGIRADERAIRVDTVLGYQKVHPIDIVSID
jgi:hypothetical protein